MRLIILCLMIYCHILDDFKLQGILANFKQKSWWKENYPQKLYEKDWIISLFIHSIQWSISILLPVFAVCLFNLYVVNVYIVMLIMIANICIHALIDDLKANRKVISLTTDQCLHMIQIICTWAVIFA